MPDYDEDLLVAEEMNRVGGGFVSALGIAAAKADPGNLQRIKAAFPEYWARYRQLALERVQREGSAS